ncbi:unnamed protein product [Mytilus coruscus]|uniref:Uncharacterized protein n=1 Tax=Mytilus coruscus TaxID=42192 RepID=A0A6J8ECX7_MYTCO|nr:unnamed protein product [Mytilus coruscus]
MKENSIRMNKTISYKTAEKSSDLADTVELFKTILDDKLGELKSELIQEQDSLKRKIKEHVSLNLKREDKLKGRYKKIRIADSSPPGWGTVREYEANAVASGSEDEKKIRQAETRAIGTNKEKSKYRQQLYPKNPTRQQPAEPYGYPAYAQRYQRSQQPPFLVGASKAFYLKCGYFHIDICPQLHTFLSFQWEARSLAQLVGRIISMTPVIGNVARIMSHFCYMEIESRIGWDNHISGYKPLKVLSELKFWLGNIALIYCRKLCHYSKSSAVIYSDASNIAASAYTVKLENKIFHTMWTCSEMAQSSAWR